MRRRHFLRVASAGALLANASPQFADQAPVIGPATAKDWLARWETHILAGARDRYCDRALGEDLGWRVSPFLNGFYYGYLATRDTKWVGMLVDWSDSWFGRGVKEPDGFPGWPMQDPDGPASTGLFASSLLGEAMALRPVVLMASEILRTPALLARWGSKARGYLEIAGRIFEKWDSRSAWRDLNDGGGVWVQPPFGIDRETGQWTADYQQRTTGGFTHPDNKENEIALWLLAMHDATGKPIYRSRAERWFRLMRSRLKPREDGKYLVWNYWEPAGPWDRKADGSLKHWVGVHPNGGYYHIDVSAMVAAFNHGLIFTREDIGRLIATNRDFMWNREIHPAKFQRIDGGQPDPRWKDSPGVLWTDLIAFDETLRRIFVANHNPATWGGISTTPWAATLHAA